MRRTLSDQLKDWHDTEYMHSLIAPDGTREKQRYMTTRKAKENNERLRGSGYWWFRTK